MLSVTARKFFQSFFKKYTGFLIFLLFLLYPALGLSYPQYYDALKFVYPDSKFKGCSICHADEKGMSLNTYGEDILKSAKKIKKESANSLDKNKIDPVYIAEAIKGIEITDSDSDGYINKEETILGSNPGNKDSLPDFSKDYGFFKLTSPLNHPRYLHSLVLLPNGKVLVTGGVTTGMKVLSSAEIYDPITEQFTIIGEMNSPRCSHSSILLPDGRVLIIGGRAGVKADSEVLSSCEVYDPEKNKFSFGPSLNERRRSPTATLLIDGRVLVAGGGKGIGTYDLSEGLKSCEIYDPKKDKFFLTGEMNDPRQYNQATLLSDGRVLITGGSRKGAVETLKSAEIYDPKIEKFSITGSMGKKRMSHSSTLLPDGKVLIAGGIDLANYIPIAGVEVYDPITGRFIPTSSMLTPRAAVKGVILNDGKILFSGGSLFPPMFHKSSELYDPQKGIFSFSSPMHVPRNNISPIKLLDGRVLYCGGITLDSKFIRMAELYIPFPLSKEEKIKKEKYLNTGQTKPLEPFIKVEKVRGNVPFKTKFFAGAKGANRIISYIWDFDDGSDALGREVEHIFSCPGNYQVSLSLIYDDGNMGKAVTSVEVLGDKKDISFRCQVRPVLDKYCVRCHGTIGNLSLNSYKEIMKGGKSGKVVIPGKPNDSLLVQRITNNFHQIMLPAPGIAPSEIEIIKTWIEQGTRDN